VIIVSADLKKINHELFNCRVRFIEDPISTLTNYYKYIIVPEALLMHIYTTRNNI